MKTASSGRSKLYVAALLLLVIGFFSLQPGTVQAQVNVDFNSSGLAGESSNNPTSLQFGPDGRLYVSQQNGTIYAYNVVRNGPSDYAVTNTETINLVKNIQNHNDDGTTSSQSNRQVTGIYVTGTGANPILYVSSSDPRIGAGGGGNDNGLDTNSGMVSRLECIGGTTGVIGTNLQCSQWEKVDLIRGLPRSEENHATNGLALDESTNTLYLAVGGHTNAGSPSNNFAFTVEYTYSSTVIAIDLDMLESMPILTDPNNGSQYIYDLPTLDDPTRENVDENGNPASEDPRDANYSPLDVGDPFGGNDGLNMAKIDLSGPVSIYAPGFRNLYDIVLTEGGLMYGVDNGANGGWGGHPAGEADYDAEYSSNPACTNEYLSGEPGSGGTGPGGDDQVNNKNGLQLIEPLDSGDFNYVAAQTYYYGGHAHPILANPGTPMDFINDAFPYAPGGAGLYTQGQGGSVDNHTNGALWRTTILDPSDANFASQSLPVDWPPVPPGSEFIAACDFRNSGQDDNSLANYGPSTNGITEYTASNFGGARQGWLLLAGFNGNIYEVELSANGKVAENCPTVPQNGSSTVSNCNEIFASGFGSSPLDVVAQGDDDPFGGTVWAATYGADNITVFEPADYAGNDPGTCDGTDDDTIDEDGDLYTNADEIDAGTNPCSGANQPADFDDALEFGNSNQFKRSDLNDDDDDNDGIADVDDSFTFDASNGFGPIGTLPLRLELFNSTGYGFGGIGFTGIMTNGADDYFTLIDDSGDELVYGGTAGIYTDPTVSAGDAYQSENDQQNGFQFGVDVSTATGPFTVESQINGPFFNNDSTPDNYASHGIFIGTGDQDNYVKFVLTGNVTGEPAGFQIVFENNASTSGSNNDQKIPVANILDATAIKLYLSIDPAAGTVQASYSADGSPRTDIGNPITLTGDLLAAVQGTYTIDGTPSALAVGTIATSTGAAPEFAASWDYFEVTQNPSETQAIVTVNTGGLNGSTFGNSSFYIENTSASGAQITKVTFDLSTAVIPEVVFDPNGTAGDGTSKDLTLNGGSDGGTNLTSHSFAQAYEGGFYQLDVNFGDFNPGESVEFGLDIDPVSIKGGSAPGPNESGSVSGLELTGARVFVEFDTGEIWEVDLFAVAGDNSDSTNIVRNALPQPVSIEMTGVDTQTTAFTASQEIILTGVEGSVGQEVRLLHLEAGLFVEDLGGPYAGVGYDIDPWEINSVIAVNEYTDTIDNSNVATFNVTLTDSDPEAGYNLFVAVAVDDDGATSPISNVILVEYDPDAAPTIVYRFNTEQETIPATDGGPDWIGMGGAGAQSGTGWAVNTGSISTHNISERDASVPGYVPQAIYDKERWDQPSGDEMEFTFDVDPGTYQVNIFTGNGFSGTSEVGERVFDISIEGQLIYNDLDLIPTFGHQVGGMLSHIVTVNDGTLNILLEHVVENPTVNGIEILRYGGGTGETPITVDPIADQNNVEGDEIGNAGLAVAATGGDGNLSYSAQDLPPGVQLEPTNGQFFGTVAAGSAGTYNVVVTVDDDDSNSNDAVTTSFTWTITEPIVILPGETLYRVNTGGPELAATDGGPAWEQDQGSFGGTNNSEYLVALSSGTSTYSMSSGNAYPGPNVANASVPSYVPIEVFDTERYDAESTPEMLWQFAVPAGTEVEIRLYFAEIFNGIDAAGERVFDISVDGTVPAVFTGIDPFSIAGGETVGFMLSYVTTSDGVIDLEFIHSVENPAIKGIEIVAVETEAPVIDPIADVQSGILGRYETGRFLVTATDPQDDGITFSATGLPAGLSIDPPSGEIIGEVAPSALTGGPNNDGVHLVTVTATDDSPEQNSSDVSFTFTIVERTITIVSPQDGATVPDTGFTVEWTSTGGAMDVFEHIHVLLLGGPYTDDGVTRFGSQPLNGNVDFPGGPYTSLPPGEYTLELRWAYPSHEEFDLQEVPGTSIDITIVEATNLPPTVDNPGTQNNVEGETVSLPIVASPPEQGQTLTYSATNLPPNLTIDPNTGVISGTLAVGSTAAPDGAFIEENGLVVIEMESADSLPGSWETESTYNTTTSPNVNSPGSAAGGDFIIWQGSQNLSNQGVGLITYQVQITNPGTYQFQWRNQVGNGTETTEHNDTWLKIEADQFYGQQGGSSFVCPNGAAAGTCPTGASSPNGSSGNGWFKVYSSGANNWSWSTNTSDNDAHQIFATFDAPGTYNILVSARSSSHVIDRMVLFQVGTVSASQAQNLSNPESDRAGGSQGTDGSAGTYNVSVTATDDGSPQESTTVNFTWNVTEPVGTPSALVQVNSGASLGASTFGNNSFIISNTGDVDIVNVTINSSSTFMPDVVFDPVGKAGDNGAKCLTTGTAGNTQAEVGLTVPGNGGGDTADCESVFDQPHNGVDDEEGYDILTLDFTDFNGGESYAFGVDMDPTSIKGDLSTGDAGSISGFELIGATVTIEFANGATITTSLTDEGSLGGSEALVELGLPTPPLSIAAQGVSAPAVVTNENQTIVVTGAVGEEVVLIQVDGRLYIDPGNPSVGYDVDPFEANEAMAKVIYTGTIPADGTLEIPVTLLETAGSGSSPDGGINHFIAFHGDGSGNPIGQSSNVIVLELGDAQTTAELTGSFSMQGRTDYGVVLSVNVYSLADSVTPVYSFTPTASTTGEFTVSGMAPGTYEIAVKYANSLQVVETVILTAGSNTASFGELPTGDADNNNFVAALDFSILAGTFNLADGQAGYDARADFNGDGIVGALDFSLLATNFNTAGENPDGQ